MLKKENNPPLYFLILHFWIKLFGIGEFAVRFPSVLFSSLSSVAIFITGRKFFSFKTGIAASVIYTFSNLHMFFAHDARVYALLIFLVSLSLYYYLELLNDTTRRSKGIMFTITSILLCYSHYFGFVVMLTYFIPVLTGYRRLLPKFILYAFIITLSYSWYFPVLTSRFNVSVEGTWISHPIISDIYTMLWRFSNLPGLTVIFIIILMYGLTVGLKKLNVSSNNNFRNLAILFLVNYLGLFIISYKIPVFIDRYLLFTSVYFYLLIAYIISESDILSWIKYSVAAVVLILLLITFEIGRGKPVYLRELSSRLKQEGRDKVVFIHPEWVAPNLIYYYNNDWFRDTEHYRDSLEMNHIYTGDKCDILKSRNFSENILFVDFDFKKTDINSCIPDGYSEGKEIFKVEQVRVDVFVKNK